MDDEKSVLVAVRSRPLLEKAEESYNPGLIFTQNEVATQDKGFTFDYVFPPDTTNLHVYDTAVCNRLPRIFEGYNLTIFAYGQTGSGKTYTMGTNYPSVLQNESGIIFLSVTRIFEDMKHRETEYEFSINVSFLEVYKEDVYDLLCKEKKACQIREDFDGVKVVNLTEAPVTSVEEVLSVLERGCKSRSTASTAMNAHSSRSHSLFIITIEQRNKENFETKKSKFQLVDLAGSERVDQSKTEGLRFKEGIDINRGLLALGKVISALSDGKSHIPYRDSRLTRLLMDSLGGNSYTVMIACISPSLSNSDETLSTLRYASRARKIKNKPVINNDPPDVQIRKLKQQVELLQAQLYKKSSSSESISGTEEYSVVKEKNKKLKDEIHKYIARIAELNGELIKGEEGLGQVKEKIKTLHQQIQSCINKYEADDSLSVNDLITDLKTIEQEFKDLVSESQISLHEIKSKNTEDQTRFVKDVGNISSECDTSDGDNSDLELSDIGRKLQKVELQLMQKQEIADHFEVLSEAIDESSTKNLSVLEDRINVLMKEKTELEEALRNSEKMLGIERNKRYNECKSEIKSLEKEILRNKFFKKIKEESAFKIGNLQKEIQNLKSMKVKLLKKMKTENDNFRRMQIAKDREVEKLKKNDRKKEFEILKLRNNFDKQVNAFKHKIEKIQSINKRLNEALSRQKYSQLILKDKKIPKPSMESWLLKEIEVEALKRMASSEYIAAKENMGHLIVEGDNIKKASEANVENNPCSLVLLDFELEKFGQQKPIQNELVQGEKNPDRWKTVNSMIDAKTALGVLFEKCTENYIKLNSDTQTNAPSEEKEKEISNKVYEENKKFLTQIKSLKDKMSVMKRNYEDGLEKAKCENSARVVQHLKNMNDLKKHVIENLQNMSDAKVLENIQNQFQAQKLEIEMLNQKIEDCKTLRDEVEFWKEECKKTKTSKRRRYMPDYGLENTSTAQSMIYEYLEEEPAEESFQIMDDNKDPDWRMTPIARQRRRTICQMKDSRFNSNLTLEEKSDVPAKRSLSGCSCPGDCRTKRCACQKKMKKCDSGCDCNQNSCINFTDAMDVCLSNES